MRRAYDEVADTDAGHLRSTDAELPHIMSEARRVLRPDGVLLVAFQSGRGVQDASESYRRGGHDIALHRYDRTPEEVSHAVMSAGLTEVARLTRAAAPHERDAQTVLVAQA